MENLENNQSRKMQHWHGVLSTHWGIDADVYQLVGEYDLNIRAVCADGTGYILKVMRAGCDAQLVELQTAAMAHIHRHSPDLPLPRIVPSQDGSELITVRDDQSCDRLAWVLTLCPGVPFADVGWKSDALIHEVGQVLGRTTAALADFQHDGLNRDFKWNLTKAVWITEKLHVIQAGARRTIIEGIVERFQQILPELNALPMQAIHNDANDCNLIVQGKYDAPAHVTGLIDFGDICAAPRVCDLAVAAAYMVLDHPKPEAALSALVSGYHESCPLTGEEIDLIWPLLRMRLAVSVVNSTIEAAENPDDPYITISQAPAWRFLQNTKIDGGLLNARLRAACGLPVVDHADQTMAFLNAERGNFAPLMGHDLSDVPMGTLSVEHSTWPQNPFDLPIEQAARLGEEYDDNGKPWIGYYQEPRLIYTDLAFRNGPWKASDRRTVHMAVDIFEPAGTWLHAPLRGEVFVAENRDDHLDYGGLIVLRHETPLADSFYTLYGHLNPDFLDNLKIGDVVEKGQAFCKLGDHTQSGGWSPHVHFQMFLTVEGLEEHWTGVCSPDEVYMWQAICPNPAVLLNIPDEKVCYQPTDKAGVLAARQTNFGGNLSVSYDEPLMLVRGWKHHLFDEWGRTYLDAYNNVPHVGHAHPQIGSVTADQLKRINSNTRYLHPAQTAFAQKILSKLPDPFEVCYFVNSGSEANELALRLCRTHTGAKGMVTPDHGYHGNTTGAVDLSAYKFAKPGGVGQADWVELVEVADDYRGSFRRDDPDRAQKFADLVDPAIQRLVEKRQGVAGFIAETFPSVGGQIIPPKGYLSAVYEKIRAAGGLCIADEVQTGLGRLGEYYFGFEHQDAVPDIVVLGKPLGNGHPMGAVVTTRKIADSFDNGIEFFSTFGGSTLSCRVGKTVLDIVDAEGLQGNATAMGELMRDGLNGLVEKYECVGDARGMGLFWGVELINPDGRQAREVATYVKNRMRDHRILLGSEGPHENILKIRPPLTIEKDDVAMIVQTLDIVIGEVEAHRI